MKIQNNYSQKDFFLQELITDKVWKTNYLVSYLNPILKI